MLKFRFRKKELRRRSNSCPNLDSCSSSTPINADAQNEKDNDVFNKHNSCYIEKGSDHDADKDVLSPTKKERLYAQRSIRRFKKKEKEQQENSEKNLLSADDFWRKIDSLKEWLHDEQGNKEVESMQSPKLRSHFKKFIKLWNKRKLPLKYYKNCCVDAEAESSSAEMANSQSPPVQLQGHNPFTFDLPHSTLKDLPSYHHFPFLDESSEQILSPSLSSVLSTLPRSFKDLSNEADDSQFSTFGKKSFCDPHTSTSLMARQIDVRASQRKDLKSKNKDDPISPSSCTSARKFATISRSTPASSIFKSSSPQVHAVVSPTCPRPTAFNFTRGCSSSREQRGSDNDRDAKNPSPAYMYVQDAIPFENSSPSPKYWQVGFDDVFEEEPSESPYCSLSPYLNGKKSSFHEKTAELSSLSRNPSNLSRRRSKSMEDIYAVPSRLLMTMNIHTKIKSPLKEELRLTMPPVPVKKFTPTSSISSLGDANKQHSPSSLESVVGGETSVSSSETVVGSERPVLSMFPSENSLSYDLGYHSRFEESNGSHRSVNMLHPLSGTKSSKIHHSVAGVKRRSEEHETNIDEIDSPKKNRPTPSLKSISGLNEFTNDGKECRLVDDGTVDMSMSDFNFSNDSSKLEMEPKLEVEGSPLSYQQIPKKSILTGSLNPTTRTPKTDKHSDARGGKDRLSILQIKVLDKSPTFPRRKVKRRSSSLVVTPGKGLTFGNKSNARMAVSSPRRVSFAKNVKNGDDKTTTPARKGLSSSASKASVRGSVGGVDIARQRQDKAEFESFWARHDNVNDKSNSPVKEGGSNPKPRSPSKWLSPSKVTTFFNNGSFTEPQSSINNSNTESYNGSEGKGNFIKLLSPKKLFSSLQKTSSSSLISPDSSSTTSPPHHFEKPCSVETGPNKPKSILKINTTISSPIKFSDSASKDLVSSHLIQKQETEKCHCSKVNDLSHSQTSSRFGELNVDHCRSPPRLGVASLKAAHFAATQNMSSLPRSKQKLLFESRMNQSAMPSSECKKSQNLCFDIKSCIVLPTEESHYLAPPNNSLGDCVTVADQQVHAQHAVTTQEYGIDVDGNDDKTTPFTPCEFLPPPPSFLLDDTCEDIDTANNSICSQNSKTSITDLQPDGENMKSICISDSDSMKLGSTTDKWSGVFDEGNIWQNDDLSNLGKQLANWNNENDTCHVTEERDTMISNHSNPREQNANTFDTLQQKEDFNISVSHNDYNYAYSTQTSNDHYISAERSDLYRDKSDPMEKQQGIITSEDADNQLSKAVIERIKSFRSSPKVEENDGWITERRRSRGSKSKSFRNSPNRSLLPPLQPQEKFGIPSLENQDCVLNASFNTPLSVVRESTLPSKLSHANEILSSYPDIDGESSYKAEQEIDTLAISNAERLQASVSHDSITTSVDGDKGYETESRSSRGEKCKIGARGGRGDFEDESVSSMTSSDSGNYGHLDLLSSASSQCPIYDVPRTGIHVVIRENCQPQVTNETSCRGTQLSNACKNHDNFIPPNQMNIQDKEIPSDSNSSGTNFALDEGDKENTETPPKPLKPKPLVRPKPKPSSKPGTIQQLSHSSFLLSKERNATMQPTIKRRSSIVKRESVSSRNVLQSSISSSFKAINISNQIAQPVVRKRSSVANRDESFKGKSFKASVTTNTSLKTTPQKNDNKRESITPSSRRKRTSLEKCGRRSSGVSSGPEQTSFAQRKKFFQKLQQSSSNGSSTSSVVTKSKPSSVKISSSFLDKSRPKPAPKPVVRQRPGAT